MSALVFYAPSSIGVQLVTWACCLVALVAVLKAVPSSRRYAAALVLAIALSGVATTVVRADDGDDEFIILNKCKSLTPWDPEYWLLGCEFLP